MADKEIIDLVALPAPSLVDLYETSKNGAGSYKETRQQMLTFYNANIQITEAQVTNLTSDLAARPLDTVVVYNMGNETIAGTKTFSSTIVGNISGSAASATNATNAVNATNSTNANNLLTNLPAANSSFYIPFFPSNSAGYQAAGISSSLSYNPSLNLTSIGFPQSLPSNTSGSLALIGANLTPNNSLFWFTDFDTYPILHMVGNQHGTSSINFDCYLDISGNYKSSNSGSNFQISTLANQFGIKYQTGISQGSTFSWLTALFVDTSGNITLPGLNASQLVGTNASKQLVSINSGTYSINISGNSATTTKLLSAVNINGVSFDGSSSITGLMNFNSISTVTSSTQSIAENALYFNNYTSGQCVYTLPNAPTLNTVISVIGLNTASTSGWKINAQGSDTIQFGSSVGAAAGSVTSTVGSSTDSITMVYAATNLWVVTSAVGLNLTVA